MTQPANPDALVTSDWVAAPRGDTDNIRIVESNEDVLLYQTGHIPEAVNIDWHNDLQRADTRDYITAEQFADLCGRLGIGPDTRVIFYGDKSNWWAAYALWAFTMYGHTNVALMDGGRQKWKAESRPMTTDKPEHPRREYPVPKLNRAVRAFRDDALTQSESSKPLIDVRSPEEFRGERTHMPEYPQEGVLRGGHIPGAKNVPWAKAANEDGTLKSPDELKKLYEEKLGLRPDDDVVVYCRIGERSSHTWFVLTHILGFEDVKNYDGSWTEWGNSVGLPIARGGEPAV